MRCEQVAERLAGVVDGTATLNRAGSRHVEQCLRCQADLAQYRRLLRMMRTLRSELRPPPPGLIGDVLTGIENAGERAAVRAAVTGRRVVYIGGIAAATAAGAAGALVLAARNRRLAG